MAVFGDQLPLLTQEDYIRLEKIRKQKPVQFFRNNTQFFLNEMYSYIREARVFRCSIMGEVRVGKSEVGSTIAKLYKNYFNECIQKGLFDNLDIWNEGYFNKSEINFDISNVCGAQSEYLYTIRNMSKQNKLMFGQIWQIDESKSKIGGIGSYSETIDLENLNHIIAKFMQSEIWITPDRFERRNAPYGLYVYKKDLVRKVNWCLLFKIDISSRYVSEYIFMGWVRVPLHKDDEFRKQYNAKKNIWIKKEIEGIGDDRINERKKVSEMLSHDERFSQLTVSGKQFRFSKHQQKAILEDYIISGKTQNWNEVERYLIVDEARMLIMQKKIFQEFAT